MIQVVNILEIFTSDKFGVVAVVKYRNVQLVCKDFYCRVRLLDVYWGDGKIKLNMVI